MLQRMIPAALLALAATAPAAAAEPMRAVQIDAFGGRDALLVKALPRPVAGDGELLVRVHAAGVNPVDAYVRGGHTRGFIDVTLPHVPGYDLSGVVEAVGAGVEGFAVGDEVFAMLDLQRGGAYASHARVRSNEAARKPARLSHVEAAALPLVALTAWQAFEVAGLAAGQTVLIHGAAGGVGSTAIQLAKARGARVIATASAANVDFVRSLGADVVVDYRNERFEDAASAIDMVLDTVGGETQQRSLAVLKDGGVLVSLVGIDTTAGTPPRGIRAVGMLVRPDAEQLATIAALADAGKLQPQVSHVLPLADVATAHEQIESRRTRGKVVLRVVGEDAR